MRRPLVRTMALAAACAAALAGPALAAKDDVVLISRATGPAGAPVDATAFSPFNSSDGERVAFSSDANNLSAEDDNGVANVFVRDLVANTTTLVSRATGAGGAPAIAGSFTPSISGDGNRVVFRSGADNLSADDDNGVANIFVRDLVANTTTLVSRASGSGGAAASAAALNPDISDDGRYVVFRSGANNLSAEDDDGVANVFVRDLVANTTTLVSRATGAGGAPAIAGSFTPSISGDGNRVVFRSGADNLSADDDNGVANIFVRDLVANTTTLVSRATGAGGAPAIAGSFTPSISGDGNRVVFRSGADNLSADDDDGVANVFVRDLVANTTTLVSRATGAGGAPAIAGSFTPSISGDGNRVVFRSGADNLSADDDDGVANVFVRDLVANTTTLVSRATGAGGAPAIAGSFTPSISGDGNRVVFRSGADNLSADDDNGVANVFVRDLAAGTTTLVSRASGSGGAAASAAALNPDISDDGRYVVFRSGANNLSAEDDDGVANIFVRDLVANTTTLVSRGAGAGGAPAIAGSFTPSISGDGNRVVFRSGADNLSADDDNGVANVFVRDLAAGTTTFVSRATGAAGAAGNATSQDPSISGNGLVVAFESDADNLSPDDDNGVANVFVRDLAAGTTTLVSRASGSGGAAASAAALNPDISDDGRYVVFRSGANNLSAEDDDGVANIFVRDLVANTTTLVSRGAGAGGAPAIAGSFTPSISGDGNRVVFRSGANNLSADDDDGVANIFVRDLVANTTTLVSRATGAGGAPAIAGSFTPSISGDGNRVVFRSGADNLSADDDDGVANVFVRDLVANTTTLVSRATGAGGAPAIAGSFTPSISGDGNRVVFRSGADNLSADDDNGVANIFVRDLVANTTTLVSRATGAGGAPAIAGSFTPSISGDGNRVVFRSGADNLSADDDDGVANVFVRDLVANTTTLVSRATGAGGRSRAGPGD